MSTESETPAIPQPSVRQVRIEEVDGDLELTYRSRSGCAAGIMAPWLIGWTAYCVFLVTAAIASLSVPLILFSMPFLAAWFAAFAWLFWVLFGVERVRLGFEGLEYQVIALITLWKRWVPREELKGVSAGVTSYKVNDENLLCLKFETLGRTLRFACGISEEEQCWLVERLNEYLDTLRPSDGGCVRRFWHIAPGLPGGAAPPACRGEPRPRLAGGYMPETIRAPRMGPRGSVPAGPTKASHFGEKSCNQARRPPGHRLTAASPYSPIRTRSHLCGEGDGAWQPSRGPRSLLSFVMA